MGRHGVDATERQALLSLRALVGVYAGVVILLIVFLSIFSCSRS
jgi:hypothetical protein